MMLEIVSALYVASLLLLQIIHRRNERRLLSHMKSLESFNQRLSNRLQGWQVKVEKDLQHLAHKTNRAARLSEKMADRAFNIANSANLGVATIARGLASKPRIPTKANLAQNEFVKRKAEEMFPETDDGQLEWLKAVLSDEELEVLETAQNLAAKKG